MHTKVTHSGEFCVLLLNYVGVESNISNRHHNKNESSREIGVVTPNIH